MPRKRTVALKVAPEVLAGLFRLDPSMTVTRARVETTPAGGLVVFDVDAPNAPDGAVEMAPVYHHNGRPDPIVLRSVLWTFRDGQTGITEFALPQKEDDDSAGA